MLRLQLSASRFASSERRAVSGEQQSVRLVVELVETRRISFQHSAECPDRQISNQFSVDVGCSLKKQFLRVESGDSTSQFRFKKTTPNSSERRAVNNDPLLKTPTERQLQLKA
jgi:hypothetical protein